MSIVAAEQLPSGLISTVSKLSYFKTERRKLQCDVSTTAPNQQVRCKLPTSGLLNLGSMAYHAKVKISTADSAVPPLGCFIRDLRVSGDGQTIDEINNYNLLFMDLLNISCSDPHAQTRYAMGCLQPKSTYVLVNDVLSTSTDATVEAAAVISAGTAAALSGVVVQRQVAPVIASGASKWAVECDFLGFLGSVEYIMADQWPAITIEFNMDGNQILGSATGTWEVTNQFFTIDVINYAAALESFQALFERSPGAITPITYSYDRYIVQQQSVQASTTNTVTFNMASSNLRKIMYSYRKNAFNTQAVVVDGNHASNYFIFSAGDAGATFTTSLLYVNGRQYHQFPVNLIFEEGTTDIDPSGYLDTLVALGLESDNQYDNLINSHNDWRVRKFIHCYNFDWRGTASNEISGLNTQGQSDIQLIVKSSAAMTAAGQWLIIGQCSGLIHINPGRQLAIEY